MCQQTGQPRRNGWISRNSLLRPNLEDIENMNRQITVKDIESVIKTFKQTKV